MEVDFLVVGQGIAGTLLTWHLERSGKSVVVVDKGHDKASSRVAAGIINPITGRRFVKSWKIEDLLPYAQFVYQTLEQELGISIYHPTNIIRSFRHAEDENNWFHRRTIDSYAPFFKAEADLGHYATHIHQAYGYGEVQQSARVDIAQLITAFRASKFAKKELIAEAFEYEQLTIERQKVRYKGITAAHIIFAEGYQVRANPFFKHLPINGAKGQVLIVHIPSVQFIKMIKQQLFIVPLSEPLTYWIGATTENHFDSDEPNIEGLTYLQEKLDNLLLSSYSLKKHLSAVRPTSKDRRPVLGTHPIHQHIHLFNGMGTKGTSLAPYWAKEFTDYLLKGKKIDEEAVLNRFEKES